MELELSSRARADEEDEGAYASLIFAHERGAEGQEGTLNGPKKGGLRVTTTRFGLPEERPSY